ncbi:MAG: alpha/beta fold hydrolase, partial [Rubrivivax sp.]|nr:alpha/beta fold hydrolase [Rubrivivax sp.]
MNLARRQALAAALLAPWSLGATAQGTASAGSAGSTGSTGSTAPKQAEPACTLCRERLQTVDALRARLPSDWLLRLEDEPVLGGRMLVVQAGARTAPPLLLVHGLGQNGFTDWVPVMQPLARRWRVIALDLPGFGYSSQPQAKLSPTAYARVLERLLSRLGVPALPVVGHSMGGAVALRLA